ncbi:hypothetical protein P353_16765 [Comamonas testosteroni]|uniref:Uncharacterized protein n=1 Tax=Comamonas testosteroni TaxID=285 RepID=A0A096FDQ0_COMTE|nr:hypothetical protein P353_16765 [Comamonas testosteroni]
MTLPNAPELLRAYFDSIRTLLISKLKPAGM